MKKIFFITAILVVFIFVPKIVLGAVVINEVFYDPTGTDTGKEYIILYNNDNSPYSLNGHCLYASGKHYVFGSFTLGAKEKITIHWNAEGTNTSTDLYTGTTDWSNMGNSSGSVAVFLNHESHNSSNIIDFIEYTKKETWESAAVGAGIWTAGTFIPNVSMPGKALKLKTDGIDNNSPNDWAEVEPSIVQEQPEEQTSKEPAAPLTGNNHPPIPEAGDNVIAFIGQEIKFDGTKSTDPDGDELAYSWNMGDGKLIEKPTFTYKYNFPGTYLVTLMVYDGQYYVTDTVTIKIQTGQIIINEFLPNPSGKDEEEEWIEIYNDSDSIIDISGWQLDDEASGSEPFIFPKNTLIAPKSYIVFSRQITGIALNNDKDSVRLLLPEGVVFQEINYEKPPQGKSSARTPEGFVWSEPSPGLANLISPAISLEMTNKKFVYQQPIKPELTKEPSQNYVINYQNANQPEIEGGYLALSPQEPQAQDIKSQLAAAKESISKQSPLQLILIIVTIIIAGLIIGLLLVKFRKKSHQPTSFT